MYHELRGPVIKIVAKTHRNQITKRSLRHAYKDSLDFLILWVIYLMHTIFSKKKRSRTQDRRNETF